jgi:hypothetical protein
MFFHLDEEFFSCLQRLWLFQDPFFFTVKQNNLFHLAGLYVRIRFMDTLYVEVNKQDLHCDPHARARARDIAVSSQADKAAIN